TFSPESAGGATRSVSRGFQMDCQFGPEAAPVSPSAQPGKDLEKLTSGTSGPYSGNLSGPATLQSCLASRLRQRLAAYGSLEYSLTWKEWPIIGQEPICALRASPLPTSDRDYTGWPTPTSRDHKDGDCDLEKNSVNAHLGRLVLLYSNAPKGDRGALNPALARWLMGYPEEWCQAAILSFRALKPHRKAASRVSAGTATA